MSDILRRIITRFEAQPGNVRAVLGGMSSGYERTAQSARVLGREQTYLNNQLRAFGTTMRYAIAGTAVFGAVGTISTLSEIQKQLGLISAIGNVQGPGQGLALVGDRLNSIGEQARTAAINSIQPISSINDSIIALLSTVRNVPQNQLVPMVEEIARSATLSQISADDATKAFTSMQTAFGKPINLSNVHKTAQEFFMMISRVPGGPAAGGQVIQQFGQLAAVARGGQISEPQLFGLITAGLRTGIPPSQLSRGLQYMIQTTTRQRPLTKDAAEAMDKMGITRGFVDQHGGVAALGRIIDRVKAAGGVGGNVKGRVQQLSALEEQIGEEGAVPKALISGPGGALAATIFRRVHEYRTFLALYQRATQAKGGLADPTLGQELRDFQEAERGHVQDIEDLSRAWKRFQDQAKLPQAAIALQTLGQDVATAFAPVLNLAAGGLTSAASFATKHQQATALAAYGVGLSALLYGGGKFAGPLLRRGVPGGLGALTVAEGVTGGQGQWKGMPGESPQHPSFVWVMGSGLKFGGGTGQVIQKAETAGAATTGAASISRAERLRRLGRFAGAATIAGVAAEELPKQSHLHWTRFLKTSWLAGKAGDLLGLGDDGEDKSKIVRDPKAPFGFRKIPGENQVMNSLHRALNDSPRQKSNQVVGKAHVQVDVTTKTPDGRTTGAKKTGVTMDLFPLFNDTPAKAPSSRGKAKTSRG